MSGSRDLQTWLLQRGVLAADGAMGTMLMDAGLSSGSAPETWNAERPEVVERVMASYREAGAELLYTNSFGGSLQKLRTHGLDDRCVELNRAAAEIGRRAAGDDALVVGSIGPTGLLVSPLGPLIHQDALDGFRTQAEALAEGGADALVVETMTDLQEATWAVTAAASTGLPVLATMTYELTPRGFYTIMGVTVAAAASALSDVGATVLGANCGFGSEDMVALVGEIQGETSLPIVVRANAGLPELVRGVVVYPEEPDTMASYVEAFVSQGAKIVGGCCGTTPQHIQAISNAVRQLRAPS